MYVKTDIPSFRLNVWDCHVSLFTNIPPSFKANKNSNALRGFGKTKLCKEEEEALSGLQLQLYVPITIAKINKIARFLRFSRAIIAILRAHLVSGLTGSHAGRPWLICSFRSWTRIFSPLMKHGRFRVCPALLSQLSIAGVQ